MKVSVQWLRELVDLGDMSVDAIARTLTMGGLEVEEITPVAPAFSGIVVARVKSVAPHPNADKLRVTEVDAGTGELLQIVCGAPNVAEGQKVPCALVGAKLPNLEIRKAKLRGVESNGMLCSAAVVALYSSQFLRATSTVKPAFLRLESPSEAPPNTCVGRPVSGCVIPANAEGVRNASRCAWACSMT